MTDLPRSPEDCLDLGVAWPLLRALVRLVPVRWTLEVQVLLEHAVPKTHVVRHWYGEDTKRIEDVPVVLALSGLPELHGVAIGELVVVQRLQRLTACCPPPFRARINCPA